MRTRCMSMILAAYLIGFLASSRYASAGHPNRICYTTVQTLCSINPSSCTGCSPCSGYKFVPLEIPTSRPAWIGFSTTAGLSVHCLAKYQCVETAPDGANCGYINDEPVKKCGQGEFAGYNDYVTSIAAGDDCDCSGMIEP